MVQALTPKRPHEPLGKCVRPRRPDRCVDHSRTVADEDAVECGGELAVPVTDQEPEPPGPLAEIHEQVPRLLGGPGLGRMRNDDLMTQYEDLRILRGVTACQEHQPAEHSDHGQVGEADEHERRAYTSRSARHAGFWHGTALLVPPGRLSAYLHRRGDVKWFRDGRFTVVGACLTVLPCPDCCRFPASGRPGQGGAKRPRSGAAGALDAAARERIMAGRGQGSE